LASFPKCLNLGDLGNSSMDGLPRKVILRGRRQPALRHPAIKTSFRLPSSDTDNEARDRNEAVVRSEHRDPKPPNTRDGVTLREVVKTTHLEILAMISKLPPLEAEAPR